MRYTPDYYMSQSGGRRACPHTSHRFPSLPRQSRAKIILPECEGREAWLEARSAGIGGSEVGALIGVNEYETPFSVFNTKTRGGKDISDVPAVEWGHRLEEAVSAKVGEQVGLTPRFGGGLWADRDKLFLRVTPDRFACPPRRWEAVGLIECKTAGDDSGWNSGTITPHGGDGAAPLSYQAQVQWQLGILGLDRAWLGCLVLSSERAFFTVEILFDPEWFAEMAQAAERFWFDHVLTGEPPMHNLRHPKTEELLKNLHPTVVRPSVDLPDDADEWLADYLEAKVEADRANQRLEEIKNYFRMHVGDAAAGYLGEDKVVTYPEVTKSQVSVSLLKEKYPHIAEEVTVRSTHRRMTIRPPKQSRKSQ